MPGLLVVDSLLNPSQVGISAVARGRITPLRPHTNRKDQSRSALRASRRDLLVSTVAVGTALGLDDGHALAAVQPEPPFCGVVDRVPSWAYSAPWQESVVDYAGGKTWYRYVNYTKPASQRNPLDSLTQRYSAIDLTKAPVIVVSGGPGLPSRYLYSLELLAGVGRRVIFYDQVGVGNTFLASGQTCPPVERLTKELYVDQLQALCKGLEVDAVHLYGQGPWGAALALEFAARNSSSSKAGFKVTSVTCTSCGASYQQVIQDRVKAAEALGGQEAQLLLGGGASSSKEELRAAYKQYNQWYLQHSGSSGAAVCVGNAVRSRSVPVYQALAGGEMFKEAGQLAGWEVGPLLQQLQEVPVLVARGEFDEVGVDTAQQLAGSLSQGRMVTLAGAGSYMHVDRWEEHLLQLEEHMSKAEGSVSPTGSPE